MAKQKKRRPGPGGPGRPQPKPHWQPIEALAMIAAHIDGMLQADREQYETLLEAKPKPHVLDDFTINRVITAFTTQRNDFSRDRTKILTKMCSKAICYMRLETF